MHSDSGLAFCHLCQAKKLFCTITGAELEQKCGRQKLDCLFPAVISTPTQHWYLQGMLTIYSRKATSNSFLLLHTPVELFIKKTNQTQKNLMQSCFHFSCLLTSLSLLTKEITDKCNNLPSLPTAFYVCWNFEIGWQQTCRLSLRDLILTANILHPMVMIFFHTFISFRGNTNASSKLRHNLLLFRGQERKWYSFETLKLC